MVVLRVAVYQRGVEGDNDYGYSDNYANALRNGCFYGDYGNNGEGRDIQCQYKIEVSVANKQHLAVLALHP